MPQVTLTFDLDSEESGVFDALNGYKWSSIVWELDSELRSILHHRSHEYTPEVISFVEQHREYLNSLIQNKGLNINT